MLPEAHYYELDLRDTLLGIPFRGKCELLHYDRDNLQRAGEKLFVPSRRFLYKRINRWKSESLAGITSRSSIFSPQVICPERYTASEIFSFLSQRELSGRKKA